MARWLMCHCHSCIEKKWSKYQKKSKHIIAKIIIIVSILVPIIDGLGSQQVVFENPTLTTAVALAASSEGVPSSVSDNPTDPAVVIGGDIAEKIRKAFPEDPDTAVAIAMCESRLDPTREGDTDMEKHSWGLFQINQTWHKFDTETLTNPDENIRIAKEIKDRWGNWNAWSCYKQGYYKKFI